MATSIGKPSADLQVAIADWLLNSKVRIHCGTHAGAIAGWLNEHGEPEFAYPEITGYYLSWLAFLSGSRPSLDIFEAAAAAVRWVDRVTTADQPPATRYYFDDRVDWRNGATFTFDIAMLCRGLWAVRRFVPEQPRRTVIQRLLHYVLPTGPTLPVVTNVHCELPHCWSTRPGPFQLKTAAALLSFQDHPALWNTFYKWSGRVLDGIDASELHAAFYALEGLVQFGVSGKQHALQEAASCFEILFGYIDDSRSDVIAQGLRLGVTLRSLGFLQGNQWINRLAELRFRLETYIADCGAVSFRPFSDRPVHLNTWAAIFAHQYFVSEYSERDR
jgi:hypothetical protein